MINAHYTAKTDPVEFEKFKREYKRRRIIENVLATVLLTMLLGLFVFGCIWMGNFISKF